MVYRSGAFLNAETIIHLYPTKQTYVSSVKSEETYKILWKTSVKIRI